MTVGKHYFLDTGSMHNTNSDTHYDDDEVEISDLPESKKNYINKSSRWAPLRGIFLASRFLRQRRIQALLTGGAVLLALFVLLSSVLPVQERLTSWSSGKAPEPSALFYFQTLPPWGRVVLDGDSLLHVPTSFDEKPVQLSSGIHYVEWHAEPFVPLRCILVVPPSKTVQTCIVDRLEQPNSFTPSASLISFPSTLSLRSLPLSQRKELTQKMQALLDTLQSKDMVLPGEQYISRQHEPPQVATVPLQATLRFLLDTDTTRPAHCTGVSLGHNCFVNGQDCRLLCTLDWPGARNTLGYGWNIAAIFRPGWEYVPLHQQGAAYLPKQEVMLGDQQFVTFRVWWEQGQWKVAFHQEGASTFDDPNCISTISTLVVHPSYSAPSESNTPMTWSYLSAPNRAKGCLAVLSRPQDYFTPEIVQNPSNPVLLQRFGVLLAANAAAHARWPALPMVSAMQQGVVQEIAAHPAFVS